MAQKPLTLRTLRVATLAERREGRLVKLGPAFYDRLARFEHELVEAIERSRDDPARFQQAYADHHRFSELKLELYKHRERKLMDLAREQANGQEPSREAVLDAEHPFLDALRGMLHEHRQRVLMTGAPAAVPLARSPPAAPAATPASEVAPAATREAAAVPAPETAAAPDPETAAAAPVEPPTEAENGVLLVRVLEDLPTFQGLDARNYTLANHDVVTLPVYNARLLLEAGKVERVEATV